MKIRFTYGFSLTLLAIIFAIGLTFASIELPRSVDSFLQRTVHHPDVDSHADDLSVFRTELYIQHYHIRLIGYVSFGLVILLIVGGFITNKSGLASAGAVAFFLPVFGQFALTMFFLAGLGMLNLVWMPVLDVSSDVLRLGDIAYVPYRILVYIPSLFGFDIHTPLAYTLTGLGLLFFVLGTVAWFYTRFQKKDIADFWVYRLSRHPQYLGWIIWSYGLLIYLMRIRYPKRSWGIPSSLPWLLSTMAIIGVAMLEELKMRREWGEEYESYRRRTSFMFPLPRVISRILAAPIRLILRKEYPERKREIAVVLTLCTAILIILSVFFGSFTSLSEIGRRVFPHNEEKRVDELVKRVKEAEGRKVKYYAVMDLAEVGEPAVEPLIKLLKDEDSVIQEFSAQVLGKIRSDKAVQPLIKALHDDDKHVRCMAAWALGEIQSQEAIQPLMDSLRDENGIVRYNVAEALAKLGSVQVADVLAAGLKDREWYVRIANANALGRLGSEKAVEPLIEALKDENKKVRRASALALLKIRSEKATAPLTEALRDEDWEVRFYAAEALEAIRRESPQP